MAYVFVTFYFTEIYGTKGGFFEIISINTRVFECQLFYFGETIVTNDFIVVT